MRLKCNKCGKNIKINIFQHFPKQVYCISCGNKIIFNNAFRKIYRMMDFVVCIFSIMLFNYSSRYLSKVLNISNIPINKIFSYGISFILFVFIYVLLTIMLYKILLVVVYMYMKFKSKTEDGRNH